MRVSRISTVSAAIALVLMAALASVGVLGHFPSRAQADVVAVHHVKADGGLYLHVNSPTIHSSTVHIMPDGTEFDISCWEYGDNVDGDNVWEEGTEAATGDYGVAADFYLDTDVTQSNEGPQLTAQGIPECRSSSSQSAGVSSSSNTSSGSNWVPYCGPSKYVTQITETKYANGAFTIDLFPTSAARRVLDAHDAEVEEWHAVQDCVSGLYGSLADSIWDQISCHQHSASVWVPGRGYLTGDSYGLDSWHGTFSISQWVSTECGNTLGTEPTGDPISTGRPDDGVTDIRIPANLS